MGIHRVEFFEMWGFWMMMMMMMLDAFLFKNELVSSTLKNNERKWATELTYTFMNIIHTYIRQKRGRV